MTTNPKNDKKGMRNHNGEFIPLAYINGYDKRKETVVNRLCKKAESINEKLIAYKAEFFQEVDELYRIMMSEYKLDKAPGKGKGNWTFYNFDKSIKVEINMNDVVTFSDLINVAQAKLKEFVEDKSNGADNELMELVNNAFTTSKGRLDKTRLFSLFPLKIKHPKWQEAIQLIKDSITVNSTKRYFTVSRRIEGDRYRPIILNISAL